jgi:hypothetical protein
VAALALALTACTGSGSRNASVPLPTPHDPDPRCAALVAGLPVDLTATLTRRRTSPASPVTRAWGDPAVTLTCGMRPPARLSDVVTLCISGIDFSSPTAPEDRDALWRMRDGALPYLEVLVPPGVQPATPLGAVADAAIAVGQTSAKPCAAAQG